VSAALIGGQATVEIMPPQNVQSMTYYPKGQWIHGRSAVNFGVLENQVSDLIDKTSSLVSNLAETTNKTNKLIDNLDGTVHNINSTLFDPTVQQGLKHAVVNIDAASVQAYRLAEDLRAMSAVDNRLVVASLNDLHSAGAATDRMTVDNEKKIDDIVASLGDSTARLDKLITATDKAFTKSNTPEQLSSAISGLNDAAAKLNKIEDDLRSVTGDKVVQGDIKTTVHNVAQASQHTNDLIERLNNLATGKHQSISTPSLSRLDFNENLRYDTFSTDFDAYFPIDNGDFIRAGVIDITNTNDLNLQYGERYNNAVSYRAGIYNGKVGAGFDIGLFGGYPFTFDVYDPNDVHMDVRQGITLSKNTSLWVGMDDILKNSGFTAGMSLSR
jgi:hypothetical protein